MLALAFLLLTGMCALPVAAAEHTVAPSGAEYATIQEAVDWVPAGDTILVESGTYSGTVILNKRITLQGVDSGGGLPDIGYHAWLGVFIENLKNTFTCRAAGEKYKQITSLYLDEKGGGLKNPEGVACTDKGTLIVLTPERFTAADPEHVALAERVGGLLDRAGLMKPVQPATS